ncbi:AMP-binding protein, partial [Shinella yambaruensis]
MSNHLFDAIRAAARPEAIFIETGDGRRWTYGDMIALSGQLAGALAARGVRPGDRVAVQVEKSPEALMLYLACVRAGAVYLPLNTAYTLAELNYFIGDAEPSLVVVSPGAREGVSPIAGKYGAGVETLDEAGGGSLLELAADEETDFL